MTSYKGVDKKKIDKRVRLAKSIKLAQQVSEHGYNFCEECMRNGNGTYLDCAHVISVDRCQKSPEIPIEAAWDVKNINVLCRECHQKRDKLTIG